MTDWYVVHTHARAEGKAQENLRRQGYEVFLPLTRRWYRHARRREAVLSPLFPRYLFVGFDVARTRWRSIFSTIGVSTLLCQGEMPIRVPQPVVDQIRLAEEAGAFDQTSGLGKLRPGDSVRVLDGPFADIIGRLQSQLSADRVRVLLELMGRQVPTVMNVYEIEAV
jgi:transcriptional antiterminator RfaH